MNIIQTKLCTITGVPGSGKSLLAVLISSGYEEKNIFSNFEIFKNGKKQNIDIKVFDQLLPLLEKRRKEKVEKKGLIIIDEGGSNINSRRSSSEKNLEMAKLAIYSRKYNCDVLVLSQLERMNDVYFREISKYNFEISAFFVSKNYIKFKLISKKNGKIRNIQILDLLLFLKKYGYTYDTLDTSIIE